MTTKLLSILHLLYLCNSLSTHPITPYLPAQPPASIPADREPATCTADLDIYPSISTVALSIPIISNVLQGVVPTFSQEYTINITPRNSDCIEPTISFAYYNIDNDHAGEQIRIQYTPGAIDERCFDATETHCTQYECFNELSLNQASVDADTPITITVTTATDIQTGWCNKAPPGTCEGEGCIFSAAPDTTISAELIITCATITDVPTNVPTRNPTNPSRNPTNNPSRNPTDSEDENSDGASEVSSESYESDDENDDSNDNALFAGEQVDYNPNQLETNTNKSYTDVYLDFNKVTWMDIWMLFSSIVIIGVIFCYLVNRQKKSVRFVFVNVDKSIIDV